MYLCIYTYIIWLCMIKARIRWCSCRVENILSLGKFLRLLFCFLLHSILFFYISNLLSYIQNNFKLWARSPHNGNHFSSYVYNGYRTRNKQINSTNGYSCVQAQVKMQLNFQNVINAHVTCLRTHFIPPPPHPKILYETLTSHQSCKHIASITSFWENKRPGALNTLTQTFEFCLVTLRVVNLKKRLLQLHNCYVPTLFLHSIP